MPRASTLLLRVREADEADFDKPVVRIHKYDKPQGLNWGDHVKISIDTKHWVSCRLEPADATGVGRIYLSIHLRGMINKDTTGLQIAQVGVPCKFFIKKVDYLKVFLYIGLGIVAVILIYVLINLLSSYGILKFEVF